MEFIGSVREKIAIGVVCQILNVEGMCDIGCIPEVLSSIQIVEKVGRKIQGLNYF